MTRRSGIWRVAAALYVVINVGGAAYAVAMGEMPHAALHVVLLFVGVAVWTRFVPARGAGQRETLDAAPSELTDRFRNLEQSLDAVAIEVERIGEGQRFMTTLLADQHRAPAAGQGNPAPAAIEPDKSS
jgi:hypothetical protein